MQSQQPIHLVISNYNTDPRYLIPLGDSYFIYDKSDNPYFKDLIPSFTSNFKFTHNPGHNLCDILDYIIENYENLPLRVAFLKGNIYPRHISLAFLKKQLSRGFYSFLWDQEFTHSNEEVCFKFAPGMFAEINNSWYVSDAPHRYFLSLNDFLAFIFEEYKPSKYVSFPPGGCMLVERERILNNPKSLYQSIRNIISYEFRPAECFMLERSLNLIFDRTYTLKEYCFDEEKFTLMLNDRPDVSKAQKSGAKKNYFDHMLWLILKQINKIIDTRSRKRNSLE